MMERAIETQPGDMTTKRAEEDPLDLLEERFAAEQQRRGYEEGLERGRAEGEREGREMGCLEGARRGSELGLLRGYAMAYKQLLLLADSLADVTQSDSGQLKEPSRAAAAAASGEERQLDELLRLIEEYPRLNESSCEQKLQTIRLKFRQVSAGSAGARLLADWAHQQQQQAAATGEI